MISWLHFPDELGDGFIFNSVLHDTCSKYFSFFDKFQISDYIISDDFIKNVSQYFEEKDNLHKLYVSGQLGKVEYNGKIIQLEQTFPLRKLLGALRVFLNYLVFKHNKINNVEFYCVGVRGLSPGVFEYDYYMAVARCANLYSYDNGFYKSVSEYVSTLKKAFGQLGNRFIAELFYGYGATDLRLGIYNEPGFLKYYEKAMSLEDRCFSYEWIHDFQYDLLERNAEVFNGNGEGVTRYGVDHLYSGNMTALEVALSAEMLGNIETNKDLTSISRKGMNKDGSVYYVGLNDYKKLSPYQRLQISFPNPLDRVSLDISSSSDFYNSEFDFECNITKRFFDSNINEVGIDDGYEFVINGVQNLPELLYIYKHYCYAVQLGIDNVSRYSHFINNFEKLLNELRTLFKAISSGNFRYSTVNGILVTDELSSEELFRQIFFTDFKNNNEFAESFFDLIFGDEVVKDIAFK